MEDVERYGIIEVTNMALRRIDPNNNLPLHVSFDIDSLDTLEAPCTGTPGKVIYLTQWHIFFDTSELRLRYIAGTTLFIACWF